MKIALAQINTTNGDLQGNDRKIRKFLDSAKKQSSSLVIFPELALVGYPPKDFLFQDSFLKQAQSLIEKLASDYRDMNFLLGSAQKNANVLYYISGGKIQNVFQKNLLPNYDVFDERRYFQPGEDVSHIELNHQKIGITICEDIWFKDSQSYSRNPVDQFQNQNIDVLINISASPFQLGKFVHRKEIVADHAKRLKVPVVYVNLVGGNDELLFDGGSFVMNKQGEIIHQLPFFTESLSNFDFQNPEPIVIEPGSDTDQLIAATTMGLKDFVRKCGFQDVVLGLSGGIDSALVLLLAIESFGKEHVHPIFLPSQFTSSMSKEDVRNIVDRLAIPLSMIPINDIVKSHVDVMESSLDSKLKKITLENLQARVRGALLMACSSEKNALVIGTGNKSELATGYSTLYGDLIGALLPLGDLYKHQVYAMAEKLNQKYQAIPQRVFDRAPSAELSENQKDSDQLPEYDILDAVVKSYIEDQKSEQELIQQGVPKKILDKVIPMFINSEFKRKQAPPILRVSSKAFGVGRRMPIARKSYEI